MITNLFTSVLYICVYIRFLCARNNCLYVYLYNRDFLYFGKGWIAVRWGGSLDNLDIGEIIMYYISQVGGFMARVASRHSLRIHLVLNSCLQHLSILDKRTARNLPFISYILGK